MIKTIFKAIRLSDYELEDSDLSLLDDRTIVVTKWSWDYSLAHLFQRTALNLVQETPHLRILICCNHPDVLTNGRGLQKPRKGETFNLVEFNLSEHQSLPFPLHQIERGGGLTFHHEGQFIFYPILKLNPKTLSLSRMINQIFDFSTDVLNEWGLSKLSHENQLLGLWKDNKKIASMGIAIEKLTTFHGMALNIKKNESALKLLSGLNPCGLTSNTYACVEDYTEITNSSIIDFKDQFLNRIQNEWK